MEVDVGGLADRWGGKQGWSQTERSRTKDREVKRRLRKQAKKGSKKREKQAQKDEYKHWIKMNIAQAELNEIYENEATIRGGHPHSNEFHGATHAYMTGGDPGGLSLPHLRDMQPTDALAERDEFGKVYKKGQSQLPEMPGAKSKGSSGSTAGGRTKQRGTSTRRGGTRRSGTKPHDIESDQQLGSEEARVQEERHTNVRLRRMLGNANLSKNEMSILCSKIMPSLKESQKAQAEIEFKEQLERERRMLAHQKALAPITSDEGGSYSQKSPSPLRGMRGSPTKPSRVESLGSVAPQRF